MCRPSASVKVFLVSVVVQSKEPVPNPATYIGSALLFNIEVMGKKYLNLVRPMRVVEPILVKVVFHDQAVLLMISHTFT